MHELVEGAARLLVPRVGPARGPASSRTPVFHNPAMAPARDLCTLFVAAAGMALGRRLRAVDGLAGTGVRAIRLALETGLDFEALVANDRSPEAHELILKNIALNGLEGLVSASRSDLRALLYQERFDYIDIDPFGSPVPFLQPAAASVRHGGFIGLTATDTGPLCGTNPRTCLRRYQALSARSEYMHETAARILIGFCVRSAAGIDIALRPVLVHSRDHYIRVYLKALRSPARAAEVLGELGYVGPGREMTPYIPEPGRPAAPFHVPGGPGAGAGGGHGGERGTEFAGPLWLGELFDRGLLDGVLNAFRKRAREGPPLARKQQLAKTLSAMDEEAGMPPFFYELDAVVKGGHSGPPSLSAMLAALRAAGFRASRTHFCPTGFRTDAPPEEVRRLAVEAALRRRGDMGRGELRGH
ncbi:MAG: tRNA (guanine(26)-N(2))-dimethyltransferase [Thermoplasmata archaeon]